MWKLRDAYKVLVGNPEWRGKFGRPKVTGEYNIEPDLKEIVNLCEVVEWVQLA
jgi:hypothetical protein